MNGVLQHDQQPDNSSLPLIQKRGHRPIQCLIPGDAANLLI